MTNQNLLKLIKQGGLIPATKRDLSLFTLSLLGVCYTDLMKKQVGYSFKMLGGLGDGEQWKTMMNEKSVGEKVANALNKSVNPEKDFFTPARNLCLKSIADFKLAKKISKKDQWKAVEIMCDFAPCYFLGLGIYNSFWRCFGDKTPSNPAELALINKIAKERDQISKTYPEIEKLLVSSLSKIEHSMHLDSGLLQCFVLKEMKQFLKQRKISKAQINILKNRQRGYFYFINEKTQEETIFTDKKLIDKIRKKYFTYNGNVNIIKGHSAYRGVVRGIVFLLGTKAKAPKSFVLVAPTTHPKDIYWIKKCSAIVTDEGGVLSHAAIMAREYKIPGVIGTKVATQVFQNGDFVKVDADNGVVKKIK